MTFSFSSVRFKKSPLVRKCSRPRELSLCLSSNSFSDMQQRRRSLATFIAFSANRFCSSAEDQTLASCSSVFRGTTFTLTLVENFTAFFLGGHAADVPSDSNPCEVASTCTGSRISCFRFARRDTAAFSRVGKVTDLAAPLCDRSDGAEWSWLRCLCGLCMALAVQSMYL
jgi:hypothetical protein